MTDRPDPTRVTVLPGLFGETGDGWFSRWRARRRDRVEGRRYVGPTGVLCRWCSEPISRHISGGYRPPWWTHDSDGLVMRVIDGALHEAEPKRPAGAG